MLEFLLGFANRRVQALLVPHGLTQAVVSEGHELLRAATQARVVSTPLATSVGLIPELDAFENTWYPIAQATLTRHFPNIATWFFDGLAQTSGIDLVVSTTTFARRFRTLEAGTSPFGAGGNQAVALLGERGLVPARIEELEALLAGLERFDPEQPVEPTTDTVSEDKMWQWYLEWSRIARTVIHDRRLLRSLGFLKSGASTDSDEDEDEDEDAASTEETEVSRR
jgi:hypothetical protein